jgi:hypothetical protein
VGASPFSCDPVCTEMHLITILKFDTTGFNGLLL